MNCLWGRQTTPSRGCSARANFRCSHSCVWVQRGHHGSWAGPCPWSWAWTWLRAVELWGLAATRGPGESSESCAAWVRKKWAGRGHTLTRGHVDTDSASGFGWGLWRRR